MVHDKYKVFRLPESHNGWSIESSEGASVDLPDCIFDELNTGKFIVASQILDKMKYIVLNLAGIDENTKEITAQTIREFNTNTTLDYFVLFCDNTINDEVENISSIAEYEKYHTIYMDVDDNNKIHAYINTPKDGVLKCIFPRDLRTYAYKNNIKYWTNDYKIASGKNGGKFVRPVGNPIEIMH